MSTDAVVMLVVGALLLWGGLAASVANYLRASRREAAEQRADPAAP